MSRWTVKSCFLALFFDFTFNLRLWSSKLHARLGCWIGWQKKADCLSQLDLFERKVISNLGATFFNRKKAFRNIISYWSTWYCIVQFARIQIIAEGICEDLFQYRDNPLHSLFRLQYLNVTKTFSWIYECLLRLVWVLKALTHCAVRGLESSNLLYVLVLSHEVSHLGIKTSKYSKMSHTWNVCSEFRFYTSGLIRDYISIGSSNSMCRRASLGAIWQKMGQGSVWRKFLTCDDVICYWHCCSALYGCLHVSSCRKRLPQF